MSQETKWTPGPWVIDDATRPAEICTIHHTSHHNGFVYVRGELGYWDADEDENMANANLIAAAPELYEALQAALACHVGTDEVWLDEARAALAKARGEG